MKARDIVGRRVVAIVQEMIPMDTGGAVWRIKRLELDNGDCAIFWAAETQADTAVEGRIVKRRDRK